MESNHVPHITVKLCAATTNKVKYATCTFAGCVAQLTVDAYEKSPSKETHKMMTKLVIDFKSWLCFAPGMVNNPEKEEVGSALSWNGYARKEKD
ncbi:hypothetical protein Tco_0573713 [Tanacetum coccineum]